MITVDQVRDYFEYNPLTGNLIWRVAPPQKPTFVGRVAGAPCHTQGYWQIKFKQKLYTGHRLIWLWLYGEWPIEQVIDHIDGNPGNNCAWNLRQCSQKENVRSGKTCNK